MSAPGGTSFEDLDPEWLRNMPAAVRTAHACVFRCDHGESPMLTLDQAVAQVAHPLAGSARADLVTVVAWLSCQVVGLQHTRDAAAELALYQIGAIVDERRRRVRMDTAAADAP